ncbi:divergent polysaccharide deacetylase family protein [candidate division KSB1 bacterium]|nr:divergent polysaccharide deacetylase family protein [candidate division KSB1 bacterium]
MKRQKRARIIPPSAKPTRTLVIALAVLAALLLLADFVIWPLVVRRSRSVPTEVQSSSELQALVSELLARYNIRPQWIQENREALQVQIPTKFRFHNFYLDLQRHLETEKATILRCQENGTKSQIKMELADRNNRTLLIEFVLKSNLPETAGYAAIIIDDFGYVHNEITRAFISFPQPLTLSIIPGLRESRTIARDAELAQKIYLVHMPMEPLNESYDDFGYTLSVGQDAEVIRLRVRSAFSQLPNAVGLNNHQGSRATADESVMRPLFLELKSLNKFFIDSRTHPSSIGVEMGKKLHVPVAENRLFLDARDDQAFIREQMERLADIASQQGKVIAIGHVRDNTLQVLQEMVPHMQDRGIQFVDVSQLLNE